jgi:hypothetical protein
MIGKLDLLPPSTLDELSRDLANSGNETRMPFPEFLKKKAFEEFGLDRFQDDRTKRTNEQEITIHKTPVGPWGDGRQFMNPDKALPSDHQVGNQQMEVSRKKPGQGLGNFFSKEHHSNVINKFGGFTTAGDEFRRLKKEGQMTQGPTDDFRPLYEEPQGQRAPRATAQ